MCNLDMRRQRVKVAQRRRLRLAPKVGGKLNHARAPGKEDDDDVDDDDDDNDDINSPNENDNTDISSTKVLDGWSTLTETQRTTHLRGLKRTKRGTSAARANIDASTPFSARNCANAGGSSRSLSGAAIDVTLSEMIPGAADDIR